MTILEFTELNQFIHVRELLKERNISFNEYSPCCLEEPEHYHASTLYSVVAIGTGMVAALGAFFMQFNTMTQSFPQMYGDQSFFQFANMLPVIFEVTILSIVLAMVFIFYKKQKSRKPVDSNNYILEINENKELIENIINPINLYGK